MKEYAIESLDIFSLQTRVNELAHLGYEYVSITLEHNGKYLIVMVKSK